MQCCLAGAGGAEIFCGAGAVVSDFGVGSSATESKKEFLMVLFYFSDDFVTFLFSTIFENVT